MNSLQLSRLALKGSAITGLVLLSSFGSIACSGSDSGAPSSSTGGAVAAIGGTPANGGSSQLGTGGSPADTGGVAGIGGNSQGGSPGTGGALQSTGGALQSTGGSGGGVIGTGGSVTTGGNLATGGAKAIGGGVSVGGALATGGSITTGGSATTGGAKSAGGTAATGGSKATGGIAATGGAKATGGATAAAGATGSGTTPITIWMAGDSTMMNCTNSVCPCGYGSQLDPYFNSNVTVSNGAVAGTSIQTWLYWSAVSSTIGSDGECTLTSTTYDARWTNMLNSMKAGDYLMIAFGINDTSATCPRHVGTALYQTLLGVMAQAAQAKGVIPIFLTPTSAIACTGNVARKTGSFLTQTTAAGTANGVAVIDLNQLTLDLYNSLGLCPNSADYTSTTSAVGLFFCNDYIHFEAAAAKQVAGLVANALRTQGIALASYLL